MNSIDVLSAMISSRESVVRGAAFAKPKLLNPLVAAGVLVPAGHVASILCTGCSEPHAADVVSAGGNLGWYCPEVGYAPADPVITAALEIRTDALAELLRLAIGARRRASPWPPLSPLVWSIGCFDYRDKSVAVYLVANVADLGVFNELCRFLDSPRGRPDGTAILTNDQRTLEVVRLPGAAQIINLGNVVALDAHGSLIVDQDAISRRALPDWLREPPSRGRPATKRNQVVQIIEELHRQPGVGSVTDRKLQRLVLAELKARSDDNATLGRGTFVEALAEYRARQSG